MAAKKTKSRRPGEKKPAKARKAAPKKKVAGKARSKKPTTNALEIIDREFYEGKPKRQALLEQARADDEIGRKIYALRTNAGLSQRELAKMVGTTASVICRLEDADYEGHSMLMLRRIAAALDKRVEIRFVSLPNKARTA